MRFGANTITAKEIQTETGPEGTRLSSSATITTEQQIRAWMRVAVSAVALIFGILVLTAPHGLIHHTFDEATKRFAAGWIGVVIGYWLS